MPEEHDVDQRGRLPEEHVPREAEHVQRAVGVGDRDREGDQRHHPRQPLAELLDQTAEKRPPAVEVDARGEGELDVTVAREGERPAQPEEMLDHLGCCKDRDRERERNPEAAAEVSHHVAMIVTGGVGCGCRRSGRRVMMMVWRVVVHVTLQAPHAR